jgi:hypothetical protein
MTTTSDIESDFGLMIETEETPDLDALFAEAEKAADYSTTINAEELRRAVRAFTLRIEYTKDEIEPLVAQRDRIVAAYTAKIAAKEAEIAQARESVGAIVERIGKVNFPDLGTWYERTSKAKLVIADRGAVEQAYAEAQVKLPEITEVDWKAIEATLRERFAEVGEIHAGCVVTPPSKSLAFRAA